MPAAIDESDKPVIFGRSSSHFTRIARIFALELGIDHAFEVVRDLMSSDTAAYGGHPALKLPTLRTRQGTWFGALNISRELARRSQRGLRVVWPEMLDRPLSANAQELALQAMATEVGLIMSRLSGVGEDNGYLDKMRASLESTLAWLDAQVDAALAELPPERDASFLETALFCLTTHVEFREVLPVAPYPRLRAFCERFAQRPAAASTRYRFDA